LAGKPIDSVGEAVALAEEVKALDLFSVPFGIPLNRLSNDAFHGPDHGSIADWFPDTPAAPSYPIQDAYRLAPTRLHLQALVNAVSFGTGAADKLAGMKYQALSIYQHWLRTGERVMPIGENPFWQIGEFGRLERGHTLQELGFSARVQAESKATNFSDLRLPWYWLAWMFDPSLQHTGDLHETRRGDYFVRSLREDGPYPIHTIFMLTRKLADQGTNPRDWNSGFVQMYEIQYSFWLLDTPLPLDPMGRRLEANSFRMSMYLLGRDIRRTGMVLRPESQRTQVQQIQAELKRIGMPDDELCETTLALIKSARPIR
jgi:hypothetical protein